MDKKIFAKRFKQVLLEKNIKTDDIIKKIGKSQGSVSGYATGKAMPPVDVFYNLCEIIGVTPNEFFGIGETNIVSEPAVKYGKMPAIDSIDQSMKYLLDKIETLSVEKEQWKMRAMECESNLQRFKKIVAHMWAHSN